MVLNPHVNPTVSTAPQTVVASEGGAPLPVGEILAATVAPPPAGSPAGTLALLLDNLPPALIRAAFPLKQGERLAVEAQGEGKNQTLKVHARSGGPETPLEILGQGQAKLAHNQPLTAGLRSILANAKGTILGEVLPFRQPGSAPVKIGSLTVNFQLDSGARSGDRLFARPQEAGGALGLQVFARGGGRSLPGPSGAAGQAQVIRTGFTQVRAAQQGALPPPGAVLSGRVLSVTPAPAGAGTQPLAGFTQPPAGLVGPDPGLSSAGALTAESRSAAVPPAVSSRATGGGRSGGIPGNTGGLATTGRSSASSEGSGTAVLRFSGFDVEVPWPPEAARAFPPGSPVRVLVHQSQPVFDLVLLGGAGGASVGEVFIPSGGAGVSGFGTNLITLGEGLGEAAGQVPQGELARVFEGLTEALNQTILKEDGLTFGKVREAIRQIGSLPQLANRAEASAADTARPDLREGLQQFLQSVRGAGLPEGNVLLDLLGQAEQTLTSVEFLQTVNGLRHFLDQGTYLQIPYSLSGERGTMDIVVRRDGGESGGGEERDQHSAVFLLDLEGLGPLRIDAGIQGKNVHARFTTSNEEVGKFIEAEMPKLREAIESQEMVVEGISWIHDRTRSEPLIPVYESDDPQGDSSFINVRV